MSSPQILAVTGAPTLGNDKASLLMLLYSDFRCRFCIVLATEILPEIKKRYVTKGQMLLAFRHFPLDTRGAEGLRAAAGAECARQQSKFWEVHDALFRTPPSKHRVLFGRDTGLGLDWESFESCSTAKNTRDSVLNDRDTGVALGVSGTPTILLGIRDSGGRFRLADRISGAHPLERFIEVIDNLIAVARNPS